jgi:hypothetical protein
MGLCLVSGKNFGFVVVDFSQGFGFVVVEWVAFPGVWVYIEHGSMGCSKINKINQEKNAANISQDLCHYYNYKLKIKRMKT